MGNRLGGNDSKINDLFPTKKIDDLYDIERNLTRLFLAKQKST